MLDAHVNEGLVMGAMKYCSGLQPAATLCHLLPTFAMRPSACHSAVCFRLLVDSGLSSYVHVMV